MNRGIMKDKIYIIAEAGVNHNGDLDIAKKLIDVAVQAGADAVKFQTFIAENLVSQRAEKAEYQKKTTSGEESQLEMIKKLELNADAHRELIDYCTEKGITFLSTPFDLESIDLLNDLGLTQFKISSGDIDNLPYLRKIGSLKKKVILSTGMARLGEIESALDILTNAGTDRKNISVLHCTTEYPAPLDEVNLNAMITIQNALKVQVGYSDHTKGITIPVAAAAMGARVIEKHFTLDKTMEGPDHKASLEPDELRNMVTMIRTVERALGDGIKIPSHSEAKNIVPARKSIVAIKKIKKGSVFNEENLGTKRPGDGISPMHWDSVIGRKANKDFEKDEKIDL